MPIPTSGRGRRSPRRTASRPRPARGRHTDRPLTGFIASRARTSTASAMTHAELRRFFLQDTWRVGDRLTINPGIRYEQQTLVGAADHAQGRSRLCSKTTGRPASARSTTCLETAAAAVRQLRAVLRADPQRPGGAGAVRRRRPQPSRLFRRQPDAAGPERTCSAGGQTNHYVRPAPAPV